MSLSPELRDRITELVQSNSVVLFMKGNRHQPQCGFSASVVGMLGGLASDYETFDVLSDSEVREGIKEFSNWPTIPQLYVNGGGEPSRPQRGVGIEARIGTAESRRLRRGAEAEANPHPVVRENSVSGEIVELFAHC